MSEPSPTTSSKASRSDHSYLYCNTDTCTPLSSNHSFYRQITSHEKDGAVSGVARSVVRDGNRVQDNCNRLNWGVLDHASRAPRYNIHFTNTLIDLFVP